MKSCSCPIPVILLISREITQNFANFMLKITKYCKHCHSQISRFPQNVITWNVILRLCSIHINFDHYPLLAFKISTSNGCNKFSITLLCITTTNVINQIKSVCGKWLGIQMPFSKLIIMPDGYCAWDLLWIEFFVLKFLLFILPTKIFCSHQGEFTLTIS